MIKWITRARRWWLRRDPHYKALEKLFQPRLARLRAILRQFKHDGGLIEPDKTKELYPLDLYAYLQHSGGPFKVHDYQKSLLDEIAKQVDVPYADMAEDYYRMRRAELLARYQSLVTQAMFAALIDTNPPRKFHDGGVIFPKSIGLVPGEWEDLPYSPAPLENRPKITPLTITVVRHTRFRKGEPRTDDMIQMLADIHRVEPVHRIVIHDRMSEQLLAVKRALNKGRFRL